MFIPDLKPPSEDELRASAVRWQERIGPLLIDRWPKELLALSTPTIFLPFPRVLTREWWHEEQPGWSPAAAVFAEDIDRACGWEMKFFRLNSRSPKDAMWPLESLITCSGKIVLQVMRGSERMLDDLVMFERADVEPVLCLRDVMYGCDPGRELRVFVRDGQVKAVAEYGHEPTLRSPREKDEDLRERAERYVLDVAGPHLPMSTIVVDLFIKGDGFQLIEINPFGLSDPVGAISYDAIDEGIPGIARHELVQSESPK